MTRIFRASEHANKDTNTGILRRQMTWTSRDMTTEGARRRVAGTPFVSACE